MRNNPALEDEVTDPTPGNAPEAAPVTHPEPATDLVVVTPEAIEEVSAVVELAQRTALEASSDLQFALKRAIEFPHLTTQDAHVVRVAVEQFCRLTTYPMPARAALEAEQTRTPKEDLSETIEGLGQILKKVRSHVV